MKLRRLKLYESYRSLQFGEEEKQFPKHPDFTNEIDPICLVGWNGCGKSNLLELLSDIFFIVDSELLRDAGYSPSSYFPFSDNKKKTQVYFMIEYSIKISNETHIIRIDRPKPLGLKSKKSKLVIQKRNEIAEFETLEQSAELRRYLPKVIAYTSGGNELISLPYTDMQDRYGMMVMNSALGKGRGQESFPLPKIMILDYAINPAVVIANYLFASDEKLELFQRLLRIKTLDSFRIKIKTEYSKNKPPIILTKELEGIIKKLEACSTCFEHRENDKKGDGSIIYDYWTFDFVVTDATRDAFKYQFSNAKELFYAFYKLNLLNTLCIDKGHREDIKRKRKQGIFIKFPEVSNLDKIFHISKVDLVLKTPNVVTEYIKISDGEHQFIHIVGGMLMFDALNSDEDYLFLMDEPDTHFNPYWRRRFFYELNQVIENKEIEMIITTHSPFIVADCHGYNVFRFERSNDGSYVTFDRSHYETYDADGNDILKELFDSDMTNIDMRSKSEMDLQNLTEEIASIATHEELIDYIQKLNKFGSSIKKLDALILIEQKADELDYKL